MLGACDHPTSQKRSQPIEDELAIPLFPESRPKMDIGLLLCLAASTRPGVVLSSRRFLEAGNGIGIEPRVAKQKRTRE